MSDGLKRGGYTIFTTCRPFSGKFAEPQLSAMRSWKTLDPRPDVLIIGDDKKAEEVAASLKYRFVPEVKRNHKGTPIVSSLFAQAEKHSANDILVYCNADVILTQSFTDALSVVKRELEENHRQFLMIGVRWELPKVVFKSDYGPGWEDDLGELLITDGRPSKPVGLDYFAYNRGAFGPPDKWPRFAIGRSYWDAWLVWQALYCKTWVVDATPAVLCVHNFHPRPDKISEAGVNRDFTLSRRHLAYVWDAQYIVTEEMELSSARGPIEWWCMARDWSWKTYPWSKQS